MNDPVPEHLRKHMKEIIMTFEHPSIPVGHPLHPGTPDKTPASGLHINQRWERGSDGRVWTEGKENYIASFHHGTDADHVVKLHNDALEFRPGTPVRNHADNISPVVHKGVGDYVIYQHPEGDEAGYNPLRRVLGLAFDQAASGKGRERHAKDKAFLQQPIMEIGRMVGIGYQLGQAMKKAQEANGMHDRGHLIAAKAELLGAINYLAAAYLQIDEGME